MKTLVKILVLVCLTKTGLCQSNNLDKNDPDQLTAAEVTILDSLLANKRGNFEFKQKKLAFVTGSSANKFITKAEFFATLNKYDLRQIQTPLNLLILSAEEKKNSNGYDAIIISWSKVAISDSHKKRLIEQLKIKEH